MDNCDTICRSCLATKESFTHFLFKDVSAELYLFCTSVDIMENEDLPRAICNQCYELLSQYSEFKRVCLESQNILLNLNSKLKYETLGSNTLEVNIMCANESDKMIDLNEVKHETEDSFNNCNDDFLDGINTNENSNQIEAVNVNKSKTKKKIVKRKVLNKKTQVKLKSCRKPFAYECELCNRKFNYRERFEAHKVEHEGKIVSIRCSPCNKTFMTWTGLRRHNENEHTLVSMESLKCVTCGKVCKSRHSLKMHHKIHGERKLSICDVCGKGCTSSVILRSHQETHKQNREKIFTCEHCGQKFFTKAILLTHVSRRHSGRKFICQICSYPFTEKHNLIKHFLIHEGKKLFKCDICDKSFSTSSSLVEHKRLHSGERPFVCNFCGKGFVSRRRLIEHQRIHTGDKPFKCGVCDLRFTQRGTLVRHMKIHDKTVAVLN